MENKEYFMNEAIKEAEKAYKKAEVPVGVVIVKEGKIIARAHNMKETKHSALMHAELIAIKKVNRKLKKWRLSDCDMYVTLEPCSMCAGAISQSRFNKVYIGTQEENSGAAGTKIDLLNNDALNTKMDVEFDVCKDECSTILKNFFKELRKKK